MAALIKPALSQRGLVLLLCTAAFAMFWIVARARIQSITIDEADTYRMFVATPGAAHWIPSSNNHVLNSMLMRLSTSLLGVSHLSLRLPALLGAAVYIASVLVLLVLMCRRAVLAWALFGCLVFNPFIMDYLVAARGYSMALGFLMAAIAVAAWTQARGGDPVKACAIASVCVALSFCSNFSFAIIDAVVLGGIALWCAPRPGSRRDWVLIGGAAVLPGLAIALYLTGAVVAAWPKNEFRWGAETFSWSMQSIGEQLFYRVSPYLVNRPLYGLLDEYGWLLLPLLGVTFAWRVLALAWARPEWRDPYTGCLTRLGLLAGGGLLLTMSFYGALVWTVHLMWPRARTGLFIPVLGVLAVGAVAAIPGASRMAVVSQRAMVAVLLAMSCYFVLCLRLTWFTEWYWNANSDRLYAVVAHYNHAYGVKQVGANWRYVSVLNFYRVLSGRETLDEIQMERPLPAGRPLYILFPKDDNEFFAREGLKVVYRDNVSEAYVAIRPEVESPR